MDKRDSTCYGTGCLLDRLSPRRSGRANCTLALTLTLFSGRIILGPLSLLAATGTLTGQSPTLAPGPAELWGGSCIKLTDRPRCFGRWLAGDTGAREK